MTIEEKYAIVVQESPSLCQSDLIQVFTDYFREKADSKPRYKLETHTFNGQVTRASLERYSDGLYVRYDELITS